MELCHVITDASTGEVTQVPFTPEEVAAYEAQAAAYAAIAYQSLRAAEYPPITDYIDGVVKGDQAQIDAYIASCQAVKLKYPKGGV